mgnify:CR=1 FL=1
MDIYSFINSPDISNYLQKIDYEFNTNARQLHIRKRRKTGKN